MADPVPSRILREIAAAMEDIVVDGLGTPAVGAVLEADSENAQAGRSEDWTQVVKRVTGAGKLAIEIDAGPIVQVLPESEGGRKLAMVEQYEFDVAITAHLPERLPLTPTDRKRTPFEITQQVLAGVMAIAGKLEPAGSSDQTGRWYEFDGATRGQPLAMWTDVVGGGSAFVAELGTRATAIALTVRFRVARGDLTTVA